MIGTDVDSTAIAGSEKNLEWFRNRYKIPKGKYHVETSDARQVSEFIAHLRQIKAITSVEGIVTEGTLGPTYGKFPNNSEIEQNFKDLAELYTASFADFSKFLSNKAKVVMCIPAYKKGQSEYIMFPSLDFATTNGYNILSAIPKEFALHMPFLRLTPRGSVIYDRKDQIVAREIVIFEKS
jgi:tRNA G10  N-methylase Trm11